VARATHRIEIVDEATPAPEQRFVLEPWERLSNPGLAADGDPHRRNLSASCRACATT
jgi:hypothetical protein